MLESLWCALLIELRVVVREVDITCASSSRPGVTRVESFTITEATVTVVRPYVRFITHTNGYDKVKMNNCLKINSAGSFTAMLLSGHLFT